MEVISFTTSAGIFVKNKGLSGSQDLLKIFITIKLRVEYVVINKKNHSTGLFKFLQSLLIKSKI